MVSWTASCLVLYLDRARQILKRRIVPKYKPPFHPYTHLHPSGALLPPGGRALVFWGALIFSESGISQ
jgi:hypothetical protein